MKSQGVTADKLQLLSGISGAFRPGVLTALMGVSGAGKTTLMDVLSGRKTGGYIEGEIYISGYPKNQATFARISGYCEQNDIHSPQITVRESLLFSAFLRLPKEVNDQEKKVCSCVMPFLQYQLSTCVNMQSLWMKLWNWLSLLV
jgi:ABC-type multidrug transport system ATPase subunit